MRVERKWRLIHLPWWFKFFADLVKSRPGIRVLAFRVSGCWAFIQFLEFICDSSRHEMHPYRHLVTPPTTPLLLAGEFVQGSVVVSCCLQVIANLLLSVSKDRACGKLSLSKGWVPATLKQRMKWNEHETRDLLPPKSPDLFFSFNSHHVFFVFPYRMRLLLAALVPSLLLRVDASKVGDWKLDL